MSHSDFLKSLREKDGRRWRFDEDPNAGPDDPGIYSEVLPGQAQLDSCEGPAARRNRKVRAQMQKRVSKPAKAYTWRLGYNHCIGQFTPEEYPALSGSALNRKKKTKKKDDKKEKADNNVIHYFSTRSRGKVKDKATAFHRSAAGNRIFLTLSFIEDIPDQLGVRILNKFLTVVRRDTDDLQYIWVAEHQEETRSTIHFHIILNKWLPIKKYNALWVLQQYNAGLRGKTKEGRTVEKSEITGRYKIDMASKSKKKDGGIMELFNPAHIERCKTIAGLSYYLTKYITKQKQKDPFSCLNWHCSRRVSSLFTKEVVGPSTFAYLLSFNNYKVDKKTGECFVPKVLQQQFFTMVYVNNKAAPLPRLKLLEQVNRWIMKDKIDPDGISMINDILYPKVLYNGY